MLTSVNKTIERCELVILHTGIYKIENIVNGKIYIGQSINLYIRLLGHKNTLKSNKHFNRYLQRSWNKYGEDNFTFEILEECDINDLNDKERYWIEKYDSCNRLKGYNIDHGGNRDYMSDEHKLNMSIAKNGVHNKTPSVYITYLEMLEILKRSSKNKKILLFAMLVYSKRYANEDGVFNMSYKHMLETTGIKERKTLTGIVNKFDRLGIIKRVTKDSNITNSYKVTFNTYRNDDKIFVIKENDNCRESFHKCILGWFDKSEIEKFCGRRHYEEIIKSKSGILTHPINGNSL